MAICARNSIFQQFKYIFSRSITTTSIRREKAMEELKNNPYFDKYADRIAALQKTSPEEFLQRIENQKKQKDSEKKTKFASVDTR